MTARAAERRRVAIAGRGRRAGAAWSILGIAVLTACSPITRSHGYVPTADQLGALDVGETTRDRVIELVGAPSSEGMQGGETWYYVSSRRQTRGLFPPETIDRQIVAISFAETGTISNIERFTLEDGRIVTLSRRVTDPAVEDLNLLRQIFGNIGTPTAEDFLQ